MKSIQTLSAAVLICAMTPCGQRAEAIEVTPSAPLPK